MKKTVCAGLIFFCAAAVMAAPPPRGRHGHHHGNSGVRLAADIVNLVGAGLRTLHAAAIPVQPVAAVPVQPVPEVPVQPVLVQPQYVYYYNTCPAVPARYYPAPPVPPGHRHCPHPRGRR